MVNGDEITQVETTVDSSASAGLVEEPIVAPATPEIFTDKSGRPSGATVGDRTFLGLSPEETAQLVGQEQAKGQLPSVGGVGAVGQGQPITVAQGAQQRQAAQSQANLLATEFPTRRELDPLEATGGEVPVLGGVFGLIDSNLRASKRERGKGAADVDESVVLQPEQLRTEALSEVERKVFDKGATDSEKFGALIEAIPVVGSLVSKYASGLIETPSGNVDEMVKTLRIEEKKARTYSQWARTGLLPASSALQVVEASELEIQKLESRMKLLINESPELRFNSDKINTIEEKILATRQVVFEAKAEILRGKIEDADELSLFLALNQFEDPEF